MPSRRESLFWAVGGAVLALVVIGGLLAAAPTHPDPVTLTNALP